MPGIKDMEQWSDEEINLRQNLYEEIYTTVDKTNEVINAADTVQRLTDEYSRKRELTGYITALKDNNLPIPSELIEELNSYELLSPPREINGKE